MIRHGSAFILAILFNLFVCVLGTHAQQVSPTAPTTWVHPGVLLNQAQLDAIKTAYAAGNTEVTNQVALAEASVYGANPYTIQGTQTGHFLVTGIDGNAVGVEQCGPTSLPNIGCSDSDQDSAAAYLQAVLWYVTGTAAYAANAEAILTAYQNDFNGFAGSTPTGGTALPCPNPNGYTNPCGNGPLQAAWDSTKFPRATEILRYAGGGDAGWTSTAYSNLATKMTKYYLPLIQAGSNSDGNWEFTMIEGMLGIAVINQNSSLYNTAETFWLQRLPAYFYDAAADGTNTTKWPGTPSPSTAQGYWPYHLWTPTDYSEPGWFGQIYFDTGTNPTDGVAQETCRDLGHEEDGISAAINAAETDWIQGGNLYTSTSTDVGTSISVDTEHRIIDALNLSAGLETTYAPQLSYPAHNPSPAPTNFCTSTGATNINEITPGNGNTYVIAFNEYHNRLGDPTMADVGGTTTLDGTQNTYNWIYNVLLNKTHTQMNTDDGNHMTIFEPLTHWVQPCQTVTSTWNNTAFPSQSGDFVADFNATPSATGTSSVIGLSNGPQTANTGLSVLIQFNPGNYLQVYNGTTGTYTYTNLVNYTGSTVYHFIVHVRPPTGTFDIDVIQDGSPSKRLATNFGFRNHPGGIALDHLTTYATTNTVNLCSFNLLLTQ